MVFPKPAPGQVIRYAYLWHADAMRGAEEGSKDRPCAIVLLVQCDDGHDLVTVLPITHTPPCNPTDALELPPDTKRRLGLDDRRSWVVVTESNRFFWPGPDLRMTRPGDAASILYGSLPNGLFEQVRRSFLEKLRAARLTAMVTRTE